MALICDTSGLLALYDCDNRDHQITVNVVESESRELYVPVILLAEIDYLLHSRLVPNAALDFLSAIHRQEFVIVPFLPEDLVRCMELLSQYRDLSIGLADAAVVAAAERLGVPRLLSFDYRHFRVIRPRNFSNFILLPADVA